MPIKEQLRRMLDTMDSQPVSLCVCLCLVSVHAWNCIKDLKKIVTKTLQKSSALATSPKVYLVRPEMLQLHF